MAIIGLASVEAVAQTPAPATTPAAPPAAPPASALAPDAGAAPPPAEAAPPSVPPPPAAAAPSSPAATPTPRPGSAPRAPEDALPGTGPIRDITELSLQDLLDWRVTTASRAVEKATEAPATVYVISKQDIRSRGYSTLSDVLKDLPGMETVEQYYSEQGTLVPVRGVVGNNKIVLLINGMRVNPPGGEELMIRNDVSVRFAEQIEIIYGPGSTLYGQDAISAVINIKTKKPGDKKAELLGAYGMYNTAEGYASFGTNIREQSDSPIAVTGFVSYRRSDLSNLKKEFPDWYQNYTNALNVKDMKTGDFVFNQATRDHQATADPARGDLGYNVFLRMEAKHASVQAWFRESQRSSTEGSGEGGKNPVLYWLPEAKWRDRSLVVEGQHALELANNLTLHSIFTFNRYEVDPKSRYIFPVPPELYLHDFKYGLGTNESIEEKLDWDVSDKTRVIIGAVATNYDVIAKASVLDGADPDRGIVQQGGVLTYYTKANDPTSAVGIYRAEDLHYKQYGVYAEGSHRFTDHLRAIAGVRADTSSRYSEVPVSPRAAVIFNGIDERLTMKYVFSMAYVAPGPYFGHNIFYNGFQISGPNPDLKPERAISNEVNLTWQDKGLLASASGFYNHQSNLLITAQSEAPQTIVSPLVYLDAPTCTPVPPAMTCTPPPATPAPLLRHSINLGSSNAFGFDLSTRYSSGAFAPWASYSYVDFKRNLAGQKSGLDQISRHNVRAGVTYNILPNLSVTPSLVLRSTPENLGDTYTDMGVSLKTPYEVNASALYSPMENLDVFVTGRNLTNHHYALRGVSGVALQEPITVMGGVRMRL
jgi:outer membrane receptor for ferrienterochelin and colicin